MPLGPSERSPEPYKPQTKVTLRTLDVWVGCRPAAWEAVSGPMRRCRTAVALGPGLPAPPGSPSQASLSPGPPSRASLSPQDPHPGPPCPPRPHYHCSPLPIFLPLQKLLPGFSEKIPAVQHCPKSRVRTQAFRPWLPTPDLNHTPLSGILFFPPGSPKCDSTHSPQLLLLKRLPPLWRLS